MKINEIHPWNVSYSEAVEIQKRIRARLVFGSLTEPIHRIAGTDVAFCKRTRALWAGVFVLSYPDLTELEVRWATGEAHFPYIPGLLSFRELPVVLKALEKLRHDPDLIFCDGQGIAHPRGLGLAAHLGILIEKPTIGCAKTKLVGEYAEVGQQRGAYSLLRYKGQVVGAVVRTRTRVKPLFVSPGYGVTISDALKMVLNCGRGYRIPDPIRKAHLFVTRLRPETAAIDPRP